MPQAIIIYANGLWVNDVGRNVRTYIELIIISHTKI